MQGQLFGASIIARPCGRLCLFLTGSVVQLRSQIVGEDCFFRIVMECSVDESDIQTHSLLFYGQSLVPVDSEDENSELVGGDLIPLGRTTELSFEVARFVRSVFCVQGVVDVYVSSRPSASSRGGGKRKGGKGKDDKGSASGGGGDPYDFIDLGDMDMDNEYRREKQDNRGPSSIRTLNREEVNQLNKKDSDHLLLLGLYEDGPEELFAAKVAFGEIGDVATVDEFNKIMREQN